MIIHQKLHIISYEHLKQLKFLSKDELEATLQIVENIIIDKLYFEYGIEPEELDAASERLEIEQDPVFNQMLNEYNEKINQLNLGGR